MQIQAARGVLPTHLEAGQGLADGFGFDAPQPGRGGGRQGIGHVVRSGAIEGGRQVSLGQYRSDPVSLDQDQGRAAIMRLATEHGDIPADRLADAFHIAVQAGQAQGLSFQMWQHGQATLVAAVQNDFVSALGDRPLDRRHFCQRIDTKPANVIRRHIGDHSNVASPPGETQALNLAKKALFHQDFDPLIGQ